MNRGQSSPNPACSLTAARAILSRRGEGRALGSSPAEDDTVA